MAAEEMEEDVNHSPETSTGTYSSTDIRGRAIVRKPQTKWELRVVKGKEVRKQSHSQASKLSNLTMTPEVKVCGTPFVVPKQMQADADEPPKIKLKVVVVSIVSANTNVSSTIHPNTNPPNKYYDTRRNTALNPTPL